MDQELIDMADMYTGICTRQEEKFQSWKAAGCPWTWQDCEAAFHLLLESTTGMERWRAMERSTRRANGYSLNYTGLLQALQKVWGV